MTGISVLRFVIVMTCCVALFQMHSSMCIELKNLVDRIMRILPHIEDARPGCSSGIQTLCLLHKALDKAKQLLQYCRESSKLYMVCIKNSTFYTFTSLTMALIPWFILCGLMCLILCFNLQAVTGDAILSRGSRAKKSLEQCLNDIRNMVPTVLDIKVCTKLCFFSCFHNYRITDGSFACRYIRLSKILDQLC